MGMPEVRSREETLTKALEDEKQLRRNDAANQEDYVKGENLWISRLVGVAERLTTQLAAMGMPNFKYSPEVNVSPNARLTLFFEGVLEALEQLCSNRATSLANEARKLCRGALTKVLTKVAYWNPNVNFVDKLESMLEDVYLAALEERIEPIIIHVDGVRRVEGQRRD